MVPSENIQRESSLKVFLIKLLANCFDLSPGSQPWDAALEEYKSCENVQRSLTDGV